MCSHLPIVGTGVDLGRSRRSYDSTIESEGVEVVDRDGREVRRLRVAAFVLVLVACAGPFVATATGLRDDVVVNGDEAVAALLPVEFARGAPSVLFPGNSYQGVLEVPVYAAVWLVAGPDLLVLRVLHQAVWIAALAVWFLVALEPARRAGRIGARAYWWSACAVAGMLGVSSVVGWPVWFRVYPGYQSGALLGGLAVLVALRSVDRAGSGRWVLAGLLAGAAVYAQPMHAPATVVVLAVAACSGRSAAPRRLAACVVGVALGVAPLVVWNLRNGMATLDPDTQPSVEHPEWGYPQRVLGVARTSWRVLSGGDQIALGRPAQVAAVLVAVGLAALAVLGVAALVRWGGTSRVVLLVPVLMLLGLPVLAVMSLQVDPRYAVGWWPGLVVLVAAGAALAVEVGRPRAAAPVALSLLVALHLLVVGVGLGRSLEARVDRRDAVDATSDLVEDLRGCGVDTVWGDYWAVYPMEFASDAELRGIVTWGPQRLSEDRPADVAERSRVAVFVPSVLGDVAAAAAQATDGTGRGVDGWEVVSDPDTGVRLALERTDAPLPRDCLGAAGLEAGAAG